MEGETPPNAGGLPGGESAAQTPLLRGRVTLDNDAPLALTTIYVSDGLRIHTVDTDSAGRFTVRLTEKKPSTLLFNTGTARGEWSYDGKDSPLDLRLKTWGTRLNITKTTFKTETRKPATGRPSTGSPSTRSPATRTPVTRSPATRSPVTESPSRAVPYR